MSAIIDFIQNNTSPACSVNVYCSALSVGAGTNISIDADEGGSPGSSKAFTISAAIAAPGRICVSCYLGLPAEYTTIDAQTITVPFNLTTVDITGSGVLRGVYVCRVNSGCVSQELLGSTTGLSHSLVSGTGVININVDLVEADYDEGDGIMILFAFSNGSAMALSTPAFTANQTISISLSGEAPAPSSAGGKVINTGIGIGL